MPMIDGVPSALPRFLLKILFGLGEDFPLLCTHRVHLQLASRQGTKLRLKC